MWFENYTIEVLRKVEVSAVHALIAEAEAREKLVAALEDIAEGACPCCSRDFDAREALGIDE